jgi:hypothetical protein
MNKGFGLGIATGIVAMPMILASNLGLVKIDDEANALAIVYLILLITWGAAGYFEKKRPLVSGMIAGLISMTFIMLTFLVMDSVFYETIKIQPDKVWGLQHSQFTDMRAYINNGHVKGFLFGLPIAALFGSVMGMLGSLLPERYENKKSK